VSARRKRKGNARIFLLLSSTSSHSTVLDGEKHREWASFHSQNVRGILFCFRCIKFSPLQPYQLNKISLLVVPSLYSSASHFFFLHRPLKYTHTERERLSHSSSTSAATDGDSRVAKLVWKPLTFSLFIAGYCVTKCQYTLPEKSPGFN